MKPHHKALIKLANRLPAECYNRNGKTDPAKNPVYISFNKGFAEICTFLESNKTVDFTRKLDIIVSSLWNNFEDRLPCEFVQIKMLELARLLTNKKEYSTAICHCYERMLMKWFNWVQKIDFENVRDFLETFSGQEFKHPACMRSLEAVTGRFVCRYSTVFEADPDLLSPHSLLECLRVMRSFHAIMSSLLLVKDLQQFILNITVHIFIMFRHMVLLGHTSKVIHYLEFCVSYVECSSNMDWRSTLSFTLCQSYYDLGLPEKAEAHARRFLLLLSRSKDEILKGSSQVEECKTQLRAATIKMALVVFKRCVTESRKRPDGFMKPLNKFNLNEVAHLPWPRTQTESLLSAMFEGSSAQFLAIMMTLADSRKRILMTSPAVANDEEDIEMADVYNELFFAAMEIISGGGGTKDGNFGEKLKLKGRMMAGVVKQQPLFVLALEGKNGICLTDAAEFVKLSFNYEQFEIFNIWNRKILEALKESEEKIHKKLAMEVEIVQLVDKVTVRKGVGKNTPEQLYIGIEQDLLCLVDILIIYAKEFYDQNDVTCLDLYLLVDVATVIWMKCKKFIHPKNPNVVHNIQETLTRILKLIEANCILFKWVELMKKMKSLFETCNMENHEPVMVGELCLTLALIVESLSCYFPENQNSSGIVHNFKDLTKNSEDFLVNSYQILEDGIFMISCVRRFISTHVDFEAIQSFEVNKNPCDGLSGERMRAEHEELKIKLRDIHTDMIFHFVRISTKVSHFKPQIDVSKILGQTNLTKSFQSMIQATFLQNVDPSTLCKRRGLLDKAMRLLCKMNLEDNNPNLGCCPSPSAAPDPPVLLSRSDNSLSFVAPTFISQDGCQIIYYKLFGRPVTPTAKSARVIDTNLPGCGLAISPFKPVFHVTGLIQGQKYVFALGAYDCKGNLIGGKVGRSTPPIMVSHPMSVLLAWSHLSKVAYDLGCETVFTEATGVIWSCYVSQPHMSEEGRFEVENSIKFHFSNYCLNQDLVTKSSDIQRQMLFMVMMMMTEREHVKFGLKEGNLHDVVTSKCNQIVRLQVCEKVTVPMKLSELNGDHLNCLSAVLQCYRILAPLIFQRVVNEASIAIMLACLNGLEKIPGWMRCLRGSEASRVISGIITCLSYNMARFMRKRGSFDEATHYIELGEKLLQPSYEPDVQCGNKSNSSNEVKTNIENKEANNSRKEAIFLNRLSASEAHEKIQALKGSQPTRYLELLIKVCQKGLAEKEYEKVLEWCRALQNIFVNNQQSTRQKLEPVLHSDTKQDKKDTKKKKEGKKKAEKMKISEEKIEEEADVDDSKFYEVMVIKCPDPRPRIDKITWLKKKNKLELPFIKDSDTELKRRTRLDELADALTVHFLPRYKDNAARRKFRGIAKGQSKWRSTMNLIKGLVHVSLFFKSNPPDQNSLNSCSLGKLRIAEDYCHIENSSFIFTVPKLLPPKDEKLICTFSFMNKTMNALMERKMVQDLKAMNEVPLQKKKSKDMEDIKSGNNNDMIECIDSLRRAVVLSHRYSHWSVLQNTCIHLWNVITRVQEHFYSQTPSVSLSLSMSSPTASLKSLPMTYEDFIKVVSMVMYMSADCLMDMILVLQRSEGCSSPLDNWLSCLPVCHYGNRKFDFPRDDGSVVNLKFIEKFVFRSIETMCTLNKWEKAAHLSLKFTAITGPWFADVLGPIVLLSQRNLLERINKNGGMPSCQPHLNAAISRNNNSPISSMDYCSMFLMVNMPPGKKFGNRALQLSSVPLDLCFVQVEFEQLISQIPLPVRSLRHSRRLLALHLLAVFGEITPQLPLQEVPTVLSDNPRDQLSIHPFPGQTVDLAKVLVAYEKTLSAIRCNQKLTCLLPQCLVELGTLYLYNGKSRKSEKLLLECIELLMMIKGFATCKEEELLRSISDLRFKTSYVSCTMNTKECGPCGTLAAQCNSDDLATILLESCGVWNCISASMALYHLARFIYKKDISSKVKCCLVAAHFFKALLRTSLLFPLDDCEYSSPIAKKLLDIHFLRGLYIFEDIHQCNPGIFLNALWYTTKSLYRCQYNSLCLPLVTMHEHFVLKTWNDVRPFVMSQVLRVQILLGINLLTKAVDLYFQLFKVVNNPGTFGTAYDNGDEEDDEERGEDDNDTQRTLCLKFNCSERIDGETNSKVILQIIGTNLSRDVREKCGDQVSCSLHLLKAELLIHLSSFQTTIANTDNQGKDVQPQTEKPTKSEKKTSGPKEIEKIHPTVNLLDQLRNNILMTAQDILRPIMEGILSNENITGLTNILPCLIVSEFEMFIRAKLLMAKILKQRHQNKMAAMTISTTVKLINMFLSSKSWEGKFEDNSEESILDAQLWSSCMLEVVDCLLQDIECSTPVDVDAVRKMLWKEELKLGGKQGVYDWLILPLDFVKCCKEGLKFAESTRDWHMQVQLLFRGIIVHAFKGTPISKTCQLLQEIKRMLCHHSILPDPLRLILSKVYLLQVDVSILSRRNLNACSPCRQSTENLSEFWFQNIEDCKSAEVILFNEFCSSKETSASKLVSPETIECTEGEEGKPSRNVYLSSHHLLPLAKLRRAHSEAILASLQNFSTSESIEFLEQALNELLVAYEYANSSATESPLLLMEILLNIACILRQVSLISEYYDILQPVSCLFQVLKINASHLHKHSITKEVFMEFALLCMSASNISKLNEDNKAVDTFEAAGKAVLNAVVKYISGRNGFLDKSAADDYYYTKVKDLSKSDTLGFVALDVFGPIVFKMSEFYASVSPLDDLDILLGETLEKNNKRVQELSPLLTWRNLLDYQTNLLRLFSNEQLMNTTSDDLELQSPPTTSSNHEPVPQPVPYLPPPPVDLPIFSDLWSLKIKALNLFLVQNLNDYKDFSSDILPGKALWNLLSTASGSMNSQTTKETPFSQKARNMFFLVKQKITKNLSVDDFVDEPKKDAPKNPMEQIQDQLALVWHAPRFMNLDCQGEQGLIVAYLVMIDGTSEAGKIMTTAHQLLMARHCMMTYDEFCRITSDAGPDQKEESKISQDEKTLNKEDRKFFMLQEDLLICYSKPLIEKVMHILKS